MAQLFEVSCIRWALRLKSKNMPTYVYEGLTSGTRFEVEQRITEAPLKTNPETGEAVKRIIFASAVVFKGSGFYKNDSRAPETSGKSSSSKAEAKTDSGKSDSSKPDSSSAKTESSTTPAPTPAAPKPASAD
jgi:predicted nucleic acid-binding Zn ribbon protein